MRFYHIGLGVWIFMLLLSTVSSLQILQIPLPNSELNASATQVSITDLTVSAAKTQEEGVLSSLIGGTGLVLNGLKFMLSTFYHSVNLISLGNQFGIDIRISGLFQIIYIFIFVFGFWNWLMNRGTKVME